MLKLFGFWIFKNFDYMVTILYYSSSNNRNIDPGGQDKDLVSPPIKFDSTLLIIGDGLLDIKRGRGD